jgi:hypothetical protein
MAGNSDTIRAYHEAGHMVAMARSPFFKVSDVDILHQGAWGGYAKQARLQMLPGEIELRGIQLPDGTVTRTPPHGFTPPPIVTEGDAPRLLHDIVFVALAGPIAEAAYLHETISASTIDDWLMRPEFKGDLEGGLRFLQHYAGGTTKQNVHQLFQIGLEARDFVETQWATVRALAKALVERKKLSGEEAGEIIRTSGARFKQDRTASSR